MENQKISFEQFCDPEFRREQQMKIKTEAIWVAFLELGGIINISKFAKSYLGKSQSWFSQKLHRNINCGVEQSFSAEEATEVAAALRIISRKLQEYADIIDNAK